MSCQSLGNTVEHEFLHAILKDEFIIVARRKKKYRDGVGVEGRSLSSPQGMSDQFKFFWLTSRSVT